MRSMVMVALGVAVAAALVLALLSDVPREHRRKFVDFPGGLRGGHAYVRLGSAPCAIISLQRSEAYLTSMRSHPGEQNLMPSDTGI